MIVSSDIIKDMSDTSCFLCNLSENENKIWEGKYLYAIFDKAPVNPGHALIVPNRHIVLLEEMNLEEWMELKEAIKEVILVIEKTDLKQLYENLLLSEYSDTVKWFLNKAIDSKYINKKSDAYNYGVNDGQAAGKTADHLHWQVIPRFIGDVEDPRGGIRFVIPEMGNYKIDRRLINASHELLPLSQ
jgi:ATP adenylyltransferase